MTTEEFERWIEDTEGSVCLVCGKGGVKADPDTGLCPACTAKAQAAQPRTHTMDQQPPNDNEEFDRQSKILDAWLDTLAFPGDWPEDRPLEHGDYFCRCASCGTTFRGHKRRVTCKTCVAPSIDTTSTPGL